MSEAINSGGCSSQQRRPVELQNGGEKVGLVILTSVGLTHCLDRITQLDRLLHKVRTRCTSWDGSNCRTSHTSKAAAPAAATEMPHYSIYTCL